MSFYCKEVSVYFLETTPGVDPGPQCSKSKWIITARPCCINSLVININAQTMHGVMIWAPPYYLF